MQATMTNAQMAWCLRKGFAWFETEDQDWRMPIWTKRGGWIFDTDKQLYVLEIV